MAAEAVGTAYVMIRAVTTRLARDIQDGIEKGAKDADADAAGRDIGDRMGESGGESFGDSFNEKASREIEDSADSPEMKRSQKKFSERFFGRWGAHFSQGADDVSDTFRERLTGGMERASGDIDVDRAAGTFGEDLGDEVGNDFDASFSRSMSHSFRSRRNEDTFRTGLSGVAMRVGQSAGEAASRGFINSFVGFGDSIAGALNSIRLPGGSFTVLAQLIIPALGGALQTLGALVGSATAVLGFLGTAAAGAGVAFLGLAAAVGPAFLIIKGAFSTKSDELDAFNEQVDAFKENWESVALATQETLLPALSASLENFEKLIPIFELYGSVIGQVVGDIAFGASEVLSSTENQLKLRGILAGGSQVVRALGDALVDAIGPFLTILQAAMPIAQQLADAIHGAVVNFAEWVDAKGAAGLTELFQKWYDRFALIMSILGNLGRALADVFGIGADSADSMFESLDRTTEAWARWTDSPEGQTRLTEFFANAKAISGEVFGIIGDIAERLFGPMFKPRGAEGLLGFFQTVREVWIPALFDFGGMINKTLGPQVGKFFDALTRLMGVLSDNPELTGGIFAVLASQFGLFVHALNILSSILDSDIAKTFGPLIVQVLLFLKIGAALWPVVKVIISAFQGLGSVLGALFSPIGLVVAAIAAIVGAFLLLYFHLKPFRDFVDRNIIDPIQRLWENIQKVGGLMALLKTLPALLRIFWDSLPKFDFKALMADPLGEASRLLGEVATALRNTFEGIPLFENIANGLASAIEFISRAFASLKAILKNPFKGALNIIKYFNDLGKAIGKLVGKGLDLLIEKLPQLGTILGKAFGVVVKAIVGLLGAAVTAFISHWALFIPILLEIVQRIPAFLVAAAKAIGNFVTAFLEELGILDAIKKYFPIVIEVIVGFFKELPGILLGLIGQAAPIVGRFIAGLIESIARFFSEHSDEIGRIGLSIIQWIGEKLVDLGSWLLGMIAAFGKFLFDHRGEIGQFGLDILGWIGEKLVDLGGLLLEWVGAFGAWFRDTGAPALVALGLNILGWIFDGLAFVASNLFIWLGQFTGWFLTTGAPALIKLGLDILGWIVDGMMFVASHLFEWLGAFTGWFLTTGGPALIKLGLDILGWIFDGMAFVATHLFTWLGQFTGWFLSTGAPALIKLGLDILGWIVDGMMFVGSHLLTWIGAFGAWFRDTGAPALIQLGLNILGWVFDGMAFVGTHLTTWVWAILGWIGGAGADLLVAVGGALLNAIWDTLSDAGKLGLKLLQWVGHMADWAASEGPGALLDFVESIARAIWDGVWNFFVHNPITDAIFGGGNGQLTADTAGQAFIDALDLALRGRQINGVPDPTPVFDLLTEQFGDAGSQMFAAVEAALADGEISDTEKANLLAEFMTMFTGSEWEAAPEPAVESIQNGFKSGLAATDWKKAVKGMSDGFQKTGAPTVVKEFGNALTKEVEDNPILPPLPNLDDNVGLVRGWASDTATGVKKTLGGQLEKKKTNEFRSAAEAIINSLSDGLKKAQILLKTFAVGLVLQIIAWINPTVRLMQTLGLSMMAGLLQGLNLGLVIVLAAMKQMPTKIVSAIGSVSTTLLASGLSLMAGFLKGVNLGAAIVISTLRGMKAKFVTAVGDLSGALKAAGTALISGMISGVRVGITSLVILLYGLRQKILDLFDGYDKLLYPVGQSLIRGLIAGIQSMMPALNSAVTAARNAASPKTGGTIQMAMGGIVTGPLFAQIGEAGAEAVIPLTRPLRALSLLHASGLDDLVRQGSPTGGDVTLLNIEHAEINDKVDVDMVAARLTSAYRAMITANGAVA